MRPHRSIRSVLLRLIGWLTVVCLLLCGVAAFVGGRMLPSTIAYTPFNQLHLIDVRLRLAVRVSNELVACCMLWSQDGRQLVFGGVEDQIFIWNWDDRQTHLFVQAEKYATPFAWSRDGKSLLVAGWTDDRDVLLRYPLEGAKNPIRQPFIKRAEIYGAAETPDGQHFIFQVNASNNAQIYRSASDGTQPEQLTYSETHLLPVLSPDGRQVAYLGYAEGRQELFVMAANGSNQRQLTHDGSIYKWLPVWSPDGREILMQNFFNDHQAMVLNAVMADGSGQRRIAEDQEIYLPSWSPDGTAVVYTVYRKGNGPPASAALYLVDADGQNRRMSMPLLNPNVMTAWQPQP